MPWLIVALIIASCVFAQAQEDCYETVRSVSTLTFAEIECREDFGASKVSQSIQSCASVLSESEFDRITRAADDAFRLKTLKEGLPSVCAEARHSISK
jgi:hypothetical protein